MKQWGDSMATKYKLKLMNPVNTSSQWTSVNPILLNGEIAFESNTNKFKIGDGVHTWNELPYATINNELIEGAGVIFTERTNDTQISADMRYEVLT